MMDEYLGNRHDERFIYRRVSWPDLAEMGDYGEITGGSVEFSALSTVKATCSFTFQGEVPDTVDAVRIIYRFTDDAGRTHDNVLGTFLCQYADVAYTATDKGLIASGTAEGSSILSVAANRVIGYPLTVPAGTNATAKARNMLALGDDRDGLGLSVIRDTTETYTLATAHTFDPDDTYLNAVNWLLRAAGYGSADVNPQGDIVFRKYVDPSRKAPSFSFANDARSIMQRGVVETSDYMVAPNVVRMCYEDDEICVTAVAKAVSGSRNSLQARGGREITLYEEPSELSGDKLAALKAQALQKLQDNGSDIVHLQWSHAYIPISCGDSVRVRYGGRDWDMNVTNMSVTLSPSCPTTTKGRTFVNPDLVTSVEGDVVWSAPAAASLGVDDE